jgi:hypothetical protein
MENTLNKMIKVDKNNVSIDWGKVDPDIAYHGSAITLPESPDKMPLDAAIESLKRKKKDEETLLDVHEVLDAFPEDALVALNAAMKAKYGWASPTPQMSFFGPVAPDLITVKTGPGSRDSVQVPFGSFTLPNVENAITTHRHRTATGPCLVITGTVRKREAQVVKELAELTRDILREHSIYKGKAIRLKADSDGDLDYSQQPSFIETDSIRESELILNADELNQVRAALWAPIQFTEECVKHQIPLNRGVLLEGPYGTGKTMTAHVTSKVCVDNGWTYILLDDVRALKDALLFAQRYQPAVVFAEDVDRVAAIRDQRGNDLLNTIDGVLTKNAKVITVLTTNYVEKLDRAMLRPGRLDAVVTIRPPESEAVQKLIRLYGRSMVAADANLSAVGDFLSGNIPATIREVVERSKLAMIANGRTDVTGEELLIAAQGMERHLSLLKAEKPEVTPEQKLGDSLKAVIRTALPGGEALEDQMRELGQSLMSNALANIMAAEQSSRTAAQASKRVSDSMKALNENVETTAERVEEIHDKVVG